MTLHATLVAEIKRFLTANKMAPSRFGRDAMGDSKFVYLLLEGKQPQAKTIDKVRSFMAAYSKKAR